MQMAVVCVGAEGAILYWRESSLFNLVNCETEGQEIPVSPNSLRGQTTVNTYSVTVTVEYTFDVEADTKEEAEATAQNTYEEFKYNAVVEDVESTWTSALCDDCYARYSPPEGFSEECPHEELL